MGQKEQVENLYNKVKKTPTITKTYYELSNQYEALIDYYKSFEPITAESIIDEVLNYAFALLKVGQFAEVEKVLKPYYDSPAYSNGIIIINYLFARQKQNRNVDTQLKNKIIESKYIHYDDIERLGAYGVLGDRQEMYKCMSKLIKEQPLLKYNIENWPIMDKYRNDEKFKELIKKTPKIL